MTEYLPEGQKPAQTDWEKLLCDPAQLESAITHETIFEARVAECDAEHNLLLSLDARTGFMPRSECAMGIDDGSVKDIAIISRVNKTVCFVITGFELRDGILTPILSRTKVQQRALAHFLSTKTDGDIIDVTVTHLEPFGAFVDIGCGVSSLIATANLSVSRIDHPRYRLNVGQHIKAVIRDIDYETGRITLSQKELLGTWEENAAKFSVGHTVTGIVRSIESYGVFVELAPNLSGLAEYGGELTINTLCAVYIKSIIPERMKIKLSIISTGTEPAPPTPVQYYITSGNLRRWVYSPSSCEKVVATDF